MFATLGKTKPSAENMRLKFGGNQAYDRLSDLADFKLKVIRHNLLYKAWTDRSLVYTCICMFHCKQYFICSMLVKCIYTYICIHTYIHDCDYSGQIHSVIRSGHKPEEGGVEVLDMKTDRLTVSYRVTVTWAQSSKN
jgi:hypothetical protein